MPLFAAFAFASSAPWLVALTLATCLVLIRHRRRVQGSTLVGPWWWLLVSLIAMGTAESVVAAASPNTGSAGATLTGWQAALLFAAAASSFCPLMSLLGAKRPQDRGWHLVVLSLWVILVLPAAESLVLRHGQAPDVQGARCWFMLILIGLGIANSLPTRHGFVALLFGGGQLLLLANSLPVLREYVDRSPTALGFCCCVLASILAVSFGSQPRTSHHSLDNVWLDFRDSFGLLWGLRVAEQLNQTARSANWPLALRWRGFTDEQGEPLDPDGLLPETREAFEQAFRNLLRRFVSPEWQARRGVDLGNENHNRDQVRDQY